VRTGSGEPASLARARPGWYHRRMADPRRAGTALGLVLALIASAAPAARSAPAVSIKARTELRIGAIRKDYQGRTLVTGQLVDRITGAGLPGQRITARIGGQAITVVTGDDGAFAAAVDGPAGPQDIAVEFRGGTALDPVASQLEDVDVDKSAVELRITLTPVDDGVQVTVRATAADAPIAVPVEVYAGPARPVDDGDEPTAAGAVPTGLRRAGALTSGDTPLLVTRKAAGGPGRKRFHARFAGDRVYAAASADASADLRADTRTTFALDDGTIAFEDDIEGEGRVVDEDGTGVASASVAIVAGDRRVGQATTGRDGNFSLEASAEVLGTGRFGLQAVVESTESWLGTSRSEPVVLTIAAPQPVPIAYTVLAFLATALCAAGFFAARTRPWRRLARREEPPATRPLPGPERAGGVELARPGLASTLRRPQDHGVAGAVRDSVRGRPVAGARIDLLRDGERRTAVSDDDGRFAIEDVTAGEWLATVHAPGHVDERFAASLPHRGELRGLRVDLVPVRERVFQLYRRAAGPLLPEPGLWGIWSPRQIVDHVRGRRPTPALAALTDFVEEAYFAARPLDAGLLPEAAARVEAAVAEQAPQPPMAS
jgi:hypothetical protein